MMAKIIMNNIKITDIGFKIRIIAFAILGKNFCISNPIVSGINSPNAAVEIFEYGTGIFPLSNILRPKVNSQKGINPKDAKVAKIKKKKTI